MQHAEQCNYYILGQTARADTETAQQQLSGQSPLLSINYIKLAHNKTYIYTCVTSKDSDQPVHPPSMVLVHPFLDSLEAVKADASLLVTQVLL